MPATVDSTKIGPFGIGGNLNLSLKYLDLGSYTTGGVAVTKTILGTGDIVDLVPLPDAGYVPEWTGTNIVLGWVDTSTDGAPLAEVATGTDVGAASFPVLCFTRA